MSSHRRQTVDGQARNELSQMMRRTMRLATMATKRVRRLVTMATKRVHRLATMATKRPPSGDDGY